MVAVFCHQHTIITPWHYLLPDCVGRNGSDGAGDSVLDGRLRGWGVSHPVFSYLIRIGTDSPESSESSRRYSSHPSGLIGWGLQPCDGARGT
jgi:hypothetical protein